MRPSWYGRTETPTREHWLKLSNMTRDICDGEIVNLAWEMYRSHPRDWRQDHIDVLQEQVQGGINANPNI